MGYLNLFSLKIEFFSQFSVNLFASYLIITNTTNCFFCKSNFSHQFIYFKSKLSKK